MKAKINYLILIAIFLIPKILLAGEVFGISNSQKGSKSVEIVLTIVQQDLTLEVVSIDCDKELFKNYEGSVEFNLRESRLETLYLSIAAESLQIKEKQGNCKQFLDIWKDFYCKKHPSITFLSTKIVKKDSYRFHVTGNLNLQGFEDEISFDVEAIPVKNERIKLKFLFNIDLLDFRTEQEDIFELFTSYRMMPAEFKFDITTKSN